MKRRQNRITIKRELLVVAFLYFIIFFNWPFLEVFDKGDLGGVFLYLFVAWIILIFLLFIIGRYYKSPDNSDQP